ARSAARKACRHLARLDRVRALRCHGGHAAHLRFLKLLAQRNNMPSSKKRIDLLLVERGLFESRARAQAAIEAGLVLANDNLGLKASETISPDAVLQAKAAHPFVSRGGVKLMGALEQYPVDVEDHV